MPRRIKQSMDPKICERREDYQTLVLMLQVLRHQIVLPRRHKLPLPMDPVRFNNVTQGGAVPTPEEIQAVVDYYMTAARFPLLRLQEALAELERVEPALKELQKLAREPRRMIYPSETHPYTLLQQVYEPLRFRSKISIPNSFTFSRTIFSQILTMKRPINPVWLAELVRVFTRIYLARQQKLRAEIQHQERRLKKLEAKAQAILEFKIRHYGEPWKRSKQLKPPET